VGEELAGDGVRVERVCRPAVIDPSTRADYLARGIWTRDTLAGRLRELSSNQPEAPAVIDLGGQRTASYAALQRDVDRTAKLLSALGARPGDVIAVQLPNWYETVVVDLAVLTLGCTLNPMFPIYRSREIGHMLRVAQTRIIVTPDSYRRFSHRSMIDGLRAEVPSLVHHVVIPDPELSASVFQEMLAPYPAVPPGVLLDAEDVSELMFTSGTEAAPKAIMHTECTTNFGVRAAARALGLTRRDVVWMPSPIGHSTGFNFGVRVALYHGLPLVLQDQWSATEAVRLISGFGCTYTVAATTFLSDVVRAAGAGTDISCMRLFSSGGAAVPATLVEQAAEAGVTVLRLYGSTEILIGTWNRPDSPLAKRIETDGVPFDDVQLQVRGDDGELTEGPGEIFVRSPSACVGFFKDKERTAAAFGPGGWVATGDLGVLDADGYLTIVGRKKEIIIRGGLNVAPREVEEVISGLPEVKEVAVIGLPDPRLGEIGCACVVLAPGASLTLDRLVTALRAKGLAAFKLPERLQIVDALPTTPTGKVQKHLLRDIVTSSARPAVERA
jgi:acyl-coenzyme A synthetase/AMP-(fatty) acid ligase